MEIFYSSHNPLKSTKFWSSFFADMYSAVIIGKNLFISDFKSTYREAFLGVLWAVIPSLFLIASYILAEHAQIVSTNNTDNTIPTFVFLLVGLFSWQNFADAVLAPLTTLQKSKKYFLKINVPIETYVFSKFFEVLLFALLRHLIVLGVLLLFYQLPSPIYVLSSFAYSVFFVLYGYSLGLVIAPLGILVQDFSKIFTYFLSFVLFCTPVFYKSVDNGLLAKINHYNPISFSLVQIRSSLIFPQEHSWWPDPIALVLTFTCFFIGAILLKIAKPIIYERIGI